MTIAWVKIKDHLNQMKFQSLFLLFLHCLVIEGTVRKLDYCVMIGKKSRKSKEKIKDIIS